MPPRRSILDEFRLDHGGELLELAKIEFDVILKIEQPEMQLVQASAYESQMADSADATSFAHLAAWKGNETDFVKQFMVIAIPKQSK